MNIVLEPGASALLDALHRAGFAAYAVGGCVRDSLLGLAPHDWDLCTAARPEQVMEKEKIGLPLRKARTFLTDLCDVAGRAAPDADRNRIGNWLSLDQGGDGKGIISKVPRALLRHMLDTDGIPFFRDLTNGHKGGLGEQIVCALILQKAGDMHGLVGQYTNPKGTPDHKHNSEKEHQILPCGAPLQSPLHQLLHHDPPLNRSKRYRPYHLP